MACVASVMLTNRSKKIRLCSNVNMAKQKRSDAGVFFKPFGAQDSKYHTHHLDAMFFLTFFLSPEVCSVRFLSGDSSDIIANDDWSGSITQSAMSMDKTQQEFVTH